MWQSELKVTWWDKSLQITIYFFQIPPLNISLTVKTHLISATTPILHSCYRVHMHSHRTQRDTLWIPGHIHLVTHFMHCCTKHEKCIQETGRQRCKTGASAQAHATSPFSCSLSATQLHVFLIKYESNTLSTLLLNLVFVKKKKSSLALFFFMFACWEKNLISSSQRHQHFQPYTSRRTRWSCVSMRVKVTELHLDG